MVSRSINNNKATISGVVGSNGNAKSLLKIKADFGAVKIL
jgi:hypothetical protein